MNDSIVKYAMDHSLNLEQTKRLVEESNKSCYLQKFASTGEQIFDVAQFDIVKEKITTFDKVEKTAAIKFTEIEEIEKVEFIAPRFVNFYLSKKFFGDSVKEILEKADNYGKGEVYKGQKIIIEHTQPNPFKEFHIGHLMNNTIGESVARIVKANALS